MVEQPHTLLGVVQLVHDTICDAVCDRTCDAYRGPTGSACVECAAHAVTRRLSGAGCLRLPPGGYGSRDAAGMGGWGVPGWPGVDGG